MVCVCRVFVCVPCACACHVGLSSKRSIDCVVAVIRPLLSEKLAQRFHIVTADKLVEFIPPDRLLPIYGGNLHYDHRAWIRKQHENEGLPYSG